MLVVLPAGGIFAGVLAIVLPIVLIVAGIKKFKEFKNRDRLP